MHYSHHVFFLLLHWICYVTHWWMRPPGTDDPVTTVWIQTAAHTFIAMLQSKKLLQNMCWQKGMGGWYMSNNQNMHTQKKMQVLVFVLEKGFHNSSLRSPRFATSPLHNYLTSSAETSSLNGATLRMINFLTPHLAPQHLPIGFTIPTPHGLGTAFPTISRNRGDLVWQYGDWWAQTNLEPQATIPTSLLQKPWDGLIQPPKAKPSFCSLQAPSFHQQANFFNTYSSSTWMGNIQN